MTRTHEIKTVIDALLREVALLVGGLAAVHGIRDDLVWRLMKGLDSIRRKVLRRFGDTGPDDDGESLTEPPRLEPHPAVQEFLRKLRRPG